jgi:uncharacterized membrane protein YgcG
MIAYNKNWLNATEIRSKAAAWHQKGLVSDETMATIQAHEVCGFYSPNVFVRIGLGIFTAIANMAGIGLMALLMISASSEGYAVFSLICGIGMAFALEFVIREKHHFASGIDDILLYGAIIAFLTAFSLLLHDFDMMAMCWIALPFLVIGSIRYLDTLCALAALACLLCIVVLMFEDYPLLAAQVLPFVGMLYAALVYFFSRKLQSKPDLRYWNANLLGAETFALILFYLSGNFYVVQMLGQAFFSIESVPMAWFFWIFTFAVPILYIYFGLRQKDRLLLDLGLLAIAGSVATFRTYYNVLPLAWAAVIAGAVLCIVAYFSIRYLQKNKGAYTYETDADQSLLMQIQGQIVDHSLGNLPNQPQKGDSFGGGDFGGGGASGDF